MLKNHIAARKKSWAVALDLRAHLSGDLVGRASWLAAVALDMGIQWKIIGLIGLYLVGKLPSGNLT